MLEAERLLQRAITIARETSATGSSQSLRIQCGCIIGNQLAANIDQMVTKGHTNVLVTGNIEGKIAWGRPRLYFMRKNSISTS